MERGLVEAEAVSYFGKRVLDLAAALIALILAFVPLLLVALAVKLTSSGPALYWSDRVGRNNQIFRMPKFRTMRVDTPAVATHLLGNPDRFLTPVGGFLRKSSLDELPQIWSILVGDMTLVGPRPALFNQDDLVALRTEAGVHRLVPGLTGWAQINGRDEIPIPQKVQLDAEYLRNISFFFDLKIIFLTFLKVLKREDVSH
jgi:O-antigen biosynthesis protein WbqP